MPNNDDDDDEHESHVDTFSYNFKSLFFKLGSLSLSTRSVIATLTVTCMDICKLNVDMWIGKADDVLSCLLVVFACSEAATGERSRHQPERLPRQHAITPR